jgi:hypothetical protein
MSRAPNWSEEEFELLLNNNHLSSHELAGKLPLRTADAVEIVRSGIHSFHRGMNVSMLSKMMLNRLGRTGTITCPMCEARF